MRTWLVALCMVLGIGSLTPAVASCGADHPTNPCKTANGHYRIVLPSGAPPYPTVMYLYGSLGNSGNIVRSRGFVEAFTRRGYALIIPAGLNLQYRTGIGSGWFLRNSKAPKKRDDTKFVAEVLADAELRHRIDRRRVLIAGMSNGGFLAWEIACHAPHLGAAYAPIAAGYLGKMPARCVRPVRMLHTHGRRDKVVSVDGSGNRVSGGARITLLDDSMAHLARSNGCVRPSEPKQFQEFTRTSWEGCPRGGTVDLLLHDGAHTIPRSWFSLVLDWFEGSGQISPARGGGTAQFKGVGKRDGRFRKPGGAKSRFKRVRE